MMNYVPPVPASDFRQRSLDIFEDAIVNRIDEMCQGKRILCENCGKPVEAYALAGKIYVTPCPCGGRQP